MTVVQLNMNSDLFSLVVYAGWNCLSITNTGIILVGASSWPGSWRKRIATTAARGHAVFCLVTERGVCASFFIAHMELT